MRIDMNAEPSEADAAVRYARVLVRGTRASALGTLAKLLHPAFFILIARLYGPDILGIYLLVTTVLDITTSVAISGLKDGVVMFGARSDARAGAGPDNLESVLATAVLSALGFSMLCIAAVVFGGEHVMASIFALDGTSAATGAEIIRGLSIAVWALPFIAIAELAIAATKSKFVMRDDAIVFGLGKPTVLVLATWFAHAMSPSLDGILVAYVATHAVLASAAMLLAARRFSLHGVACAVAERRLSRALLRYAVPQSLNLTLGSFVAGLDVLMLAWFGAAPATIAFYKIGATLVRNIRQIKVALAAPFSPIAARLYAENRIADLEAALGMVSRWGLTLAVPVVLPILLLRGQILRIFDPSFTADSSFLYWLVIPPLVACSVGMAGNVLAMGGHSRWNLLNALFIGTSNAILNALWIPRYGLDGAAAATAIASVATAILTLAEVRLLMGVQLRVRAVLKPAVAGALGAAGAFGVWRIAASIGAPWVDVLAAAGGLFVYGAILSAAGIDRADRALLGRGSFP